MSSTDFQASLAAWRTRLTTGLSYLENGAQQVYNQISAAVDTIQNGAQSVLQTGTNFVQSLESGAQQVVNGVVDTVENAVSSGVSFIKNIFSGGQSQDNGTNPANLVDPNTNAQFGTSGWPDSGLPGQTGDTAPTSAVQVIEGTIPDGGATLGGGDTGDPQAPPTVPAPPDVPPSADPAPDSYGSDPTSYYSGYPVVLDLTGKGIRITPLGWSNQFFDMSGDGYENRTAWAGPGNGVLVFDPTGSSKITSPMEFEFTRWDRTAKSDMQALEDVFDTNHDGKLDAGDARPT